MSDYRDDSHSIAVASDDTWLGLKSIVEDSAKAAAVVMFGLGVLHTDTATASDHIEDRPGVVHISEAVASDEVIDQVKAGQLILERAKASDRLIDKLRITLEASAQAQDYVFDKVRSETTDSAVASDEVISAAYAKVLIEDSAKAKDDVLVKRVVADLLEEDAAVTEKYLDKLRAIIHIEDSAQASDEVTSQRLSFYTVTDKAKASDFTQGTKQTAQIVIEQAQAADSTSLKLAELIENEALASDEIVDLAKAFVLIEDSAQASDEATGNVGGTELKPITDTAIASDETWGELQAINLIAEIIVVEDALLGTDGAIGQAWTSNTDNWAMSRYEPYTFQGLVVINGIMYGIAEDGIYQLSGGIEEIEGSITTGKLDLSADKSLVRPESAYLEYELDGTALMQVSTTQQGVEESYTYQLPQKASEKLTNGRFIFGRGLRGRHFSFSLKVAGRSAYINDLNIKSTDTNRRV